MTRREHAPYTTDHRLGWVLVALLGLGVLAVVLLPLLALRVAP